MSKGRIYLAGPIKGLDYEGATSWRDYAIEKLPEFDCFSPMRWQEYRKQTGVIKQAYEDSAFSNSQALTYRDYADVKRADMVLVNLTGAKRASIGTVMEISAAWCFQVPVILAMDEDDEWHQYPMVKQTVMCEVRSLDEAIELARAFLLPSKH